MLIDSHAHLTSSDILLDIEAVLTRAKAAGISKILNVATDELSLLKGVELGIKHSWISNAAAVHPHDADKENIAFIKSIKENVEHLKAIGETGLDYFYDNSPKEVQKESLRLHLALAQEVNLPVIIHCRDAFDDFFTIIKEFPDVRGVLHCFTGTLEEAKLVIEHNFYLSFSGIVTFKKSAALQEVARWVPKEFILVETDAPYLAPQSKRGKPNEPAYVLETALFIANLRNESFEEFAKQTYQNSEKLFKL